MPKDKASEKQYAFSLEKSIRRAQDSQRPFLDGVKIYATEHVKPGHPDLAEMITAAGGEVILVLVVAAILVSNFVSFKLCNKVLDAPPQDASTFIVIGCQEDFEECRRLFKEGWQVQSNEFLLTGILRQELDISSHKLSLEDNLTPPGSARKRK
jgi:hypothetical protein